MFSAPHSAGRVGVEMGLWPQSGERSPIYHNNPADYDSEVCINCELVGRVLRGYILVALSGRVNSYKTPDLDSVNNVVHEDITAQPMCEMHNATKKNLKFLRLLALESWAQPRP